MFGTRTQNERLGDDRRRQNTSGTPSEVPDKYVYHIYLGNGPQNLIVLTISTDLFESMKPSGIVFMSDREML